MERKLLKGGGVHTGWERCNIFPLAGPDLRQGLGPVRLGLKEKPAPWGGESLAAPTPTAKSLPALVSSEWPANCSCIPAASTSVTAHRVQTALTPVSLSIRFLFLLG